MKVLNILALAAVAIFGVNESGYYLGALINGSLSEWSVGGTRVTPHSINL
jgi:hypothetical protein